MSFFLDSTILHTLGSTIDLRQWLNYWQFLYVFESITSTFLTIVVLSFLCRYLMILHIIKNFLTCVKYYYWIFYCNFFIRNLHVTHKCLQWKRKRRKKINDLKALTFGCIAENNNHQLALVLMNSSRINHWWQLEAFLRSLKNFSMDFFCCLLNGDKYPSSAISTHPL